MNIYQKIILTVYCVLFSYFSIIHVPFKTKYNNGIEYDTLFSSSSNLDVSRFVLIIVIISILSSILFLLVRNIDVSNHPMAMNNWVRKNGLLTFIGISLISMIWVGFAKYQSKRENIVSVPEKNNAKIADSIKASDFIEDKNIESPAPSERALKKAEFCTEETALVNFKSHMKFYYPDWKIFGKPVVREGSDCGYQIQFTTINPHLRYEREVMIAKISFSSDFSSYYFSMVRGTIY